MLRAEKSLHKFETLSVFICCIHIFLDFVFLDMKYIGDTLFCSARCILHIYRPQRSCAKVMGGWGVCAIPACIAGGIPACLAAGLWGVSAPGKGVSAPGVSALGGICSGGVCSGGCLLWGVSAPGGLLLGVSALRDVCSWGVSAPWGYLLLGEGGSGLLLWPSGLVPSGLVAFWSSGLLVWWPSC